MNDDWCVCGHHRDDHKWGAQSPKDGTECLRCSTCDRFRLTRAEGQRGSEAGCYS